MKYIPALTAAELAGINPYSATLYYQELREIIVAELIEVFPERGAFEVDEGYFDGVRKGKRGRGAAGCTLPVGQIALNKVLF